ncbi:MAG: hypothetical protein ACI91F_001885 [Candidatus Binatia bacterium]|jgi:uncharacterized protein YcbX
MSEIGRIGSLYRYPVKSMRGEVLASAALGEGGIPGDRAWALRDERAGEIRGGKKFPALMQCAARFLEEPEAGASPAAEMLLPDGTRLSTIDPTAGARLSEFLGKDVTLWPLRPADDDDHYRRGQPDNPDLEAEMRDIFGRLPDEPLPDFSQFEPEILEFTSPRGTYFDVTPLHILTTASLSTFAAANPGVAFGVDRFRPNLLIDTGEATGLVESQWAGHELRIGDVRIEVIMPTVRCAMITQPTGDLPKDPRVLRAVVAQGDQNLGVYARVLAPGTVGVGDTVELV